MAEIGAERAKSKSSTQRMRTSSFLHAPDAFSLMGRDALFGRRGAFGCSLFQGACICDHEKER